MQCEAKKHSGGQKKKSNPPCVFIHLTCDVWMRQHCKISRKQSEGLPCSYKKRAYIFEEAAVLQLSVKWTQGIWPSRVRLAN